MNTNATSIKLLCFYCGWLLVCCCCCCRPSRRFWLVIMSLLSIALVVRCCCHRHQYCGIFVFLFSLLFLFFLFIVCIVSSLLCCCCCHRPYHRFRCHPSSFVLFLSYGLLARKAMAGYEFHQPASSSSPSPWFFSLYRIGKHRSTITTTTTPAPSALSYNYCMHHHLSTTGRLTMIHSKAVAPLASVGPSAAKASSSSSSHHHHSENEHVAPAADATAAALASWSRVDFIAIFLVVGILFLHCRCCLGHWRWPCH